MKYFINCEFLEGNQKENFPISLFRKNTPPTIDLISIAIVAEDGREYYQISKDFNLKEAWNRYDLELERSEDSRQREFKIYWIRENVLKPIWRALIFKLADDCWGLSNKQTKDVYESILKGQYDKYFTFKSLKFLINKYGKTNKEISEEVFQFCTKDSLTIEAAKYYNVKYKNIDLYGYYADYDHVAFCWLFGKMIDLPAVFPMYCKSLKQMLDEKAIKVPYSYDLELGLTAIKLQHNFPKQQNEQNALEDARWSKKLYEFLINI